MRILVLFAHPRLRQSVVQSALLAAISGLDGITVRDLYAEYPDLMIDPRREQRSLLAHDLLVLQHPFYWYSSPAVIKEWLDVVLEEGWAYGSGGDRLRGKFLLNALSTGGRRRRTTAKAATGSPCARCSRRSIRRRISAAWVGSSRSSCTRAASSIPRC